MFGMMECRRFGILKQPAFLVGLILGLSLSTIISQVLQELDIHKALFRQRSPYSDQENYGYVSVNIPNKAYKEVIPSYNPRSVLDINSIIDLIVTDTKLPYHLIGLTIVQTDNNWEEYKSLITTTWGADVHLNYYEQTGDRRMIGAVAALNQLCRSPLGGHDWHLVVPGNTYINIPVLHIILRQLAEGQDIVLALSPQNSELCNLDYGFIISEQYLQHLCTGRGRCQHDLWKANVDAKNLPFILKCLTQRCLNICQAFLAYGTVTFDEISQINSNDGLLSKAAVTNLNLEQLQEVHLRYMQVKTEELQKYVTTLAYQTKESDLEDESQENSKRSSIYWGGRVENSTCGTTSNPQALNDIVSVVSQISESHIQEYKYHFVESKLHETITDYDISPVNVYMNYRTELKTVHIVSQVPSNIEVYMQFMESIKNICKIKINNSKQQRCEIYMVLFKDDLEAVKFDFAKLNQMNYNMETQYGLNIKVGEIGGESFSLGRFLQIVADSHNNDDVIFLVDSHYRFNETFLDQCIANTEMLSKVYYPIPYINKHMNVSIKSELDKERFNAVCVCSNDIGNMDVYPTTYKELHQAFLASDTIQVLSVPDASLSYHILLK